MKINTLQALTSPSSNLLLVPYSHRHVPTYHDWMLSPSLREATASEPLTLEEEYAMQQSWRQDKDKLTFIICLSIQDGRRDARVVRVGIDDSPERMVGDVNLFVFPSEDDESQKLLVGELELMIASPEHRRKGYGRSALLLFIPYIRTHWAEILAEYQGDSMTLPCNGETETMAGLEYLRVKIQESNVGSIKLFEGLGFTMVGSGPNYFGEVELRLGADSVGLLATEELRMLEYDDSANDTELHRR